MKIGFDQGHGLPSCDGGAIGIKKEEDLIASTSGLLIPKLKVQGHQIILTRPKKAFSTKNSLEQRCEIANLHDCDLFVSIHFNAFTPSANGCEVYAIGKTGCNYGGEIVKNIAQLGYVNRGLKDGIRYYVLRNTKMPAILIEGCFLTSAVDMTIFDAEKMSDAIARGIFSVYAGSN
jgi:N-acetylmuramoyl-L-alanine amidase